MCISMQLEQWPQLPSRVRLMTLGTPGCSPSVCVSYANHAAQVSPVHHHALPLLLSTPVCCMHLCSADLFASQAFYSAE